MTCHRSQRGTAATSLRARGMSAQNSAPAAALTVLRIAPHCWERAHCASQSQLQSRRLRGHRKVHSGRCYIGASCELTVRLSVSSSCGSCCSRPSAPRCGHDCTAASALPRLHLACLVRILTQLPKPAYFRVKGSMHLQSLASPHAFERVPLPPSAAYTADS